VTELNKKIETYGHKLYTDSFFSSSDLFGVKVVYGPGVTCWQYCGRKKRDIHHAPLEGNFCDEQRNPMKLLTVTDYSHHMGQVNNRDRMANSYSINQFTRQWTKQLFFHLLDLSTLNSYILLALSGSKKISHRDFQPPVRGKCWHVLGKNGL
jgi:hypothetical protein